MQIPTEPTILLIERLLDGLAGEQLDRTMIIPVGLRHLAAGTEATLVQAMVTWASAQRRPKLSLNTTGDAQLENFSRTLSGMSAALLSEEAVDVSGTSVFGALRKLALERLDGIQGENARAMSRGRQIEIVCADHLNRSAPVSLYITSADGSAKLKSRSGFNQLAKSIEEAIVPAQYREDLDRDFMPALADALYELFRNTEDHARRDENGNAIPRSLRGLQARLHSITPEALQAMVSTSRPLAAYCDRLEPARQGKAYVELVEISVFDAGPGFAPRWLGRPFSQISFDDERMAVIDCFARHASSKTATGSGQGLSNVIEVLRQRDGFLRLRTGRQSLYADLARGRHQPFDAPAELLDWRSSRPPMAPVTGSLLTLLMPLTYPR